MKPCDFTTRPKNQQWRGGLASGDRKGEWVFSADMIRSIEKLYVLYEEKPYVDAVLALGATKILPSYSGEPELSRRADDTVPQMGLPGNSFAGQKLRGGRASSII